MTNGRKVKDRFRDWNYLHKGTVAFIGGIFFAAFLRAFLVIEGGGHISSTDVELAVPADAVWPWIYDEENRPRWQAQLVDISRLKGRAEFEGSTRLLFWKHRGKRWTGLEMTTTIVPGVRYETYQESEQDTRRLLVDITPLGTCRTRLTITETVRPEQYSDRFWMFLESRHYDRRLDVSVEALERWLAKSGTHTCDVNDEGPSREMP